MSGAAADIDALAWPTERLGEALQAVARAAAVGRVSPHALGNPPAALAAASGPEARTPAERLAWWMADAAATLELEAEPLDVRHGDAVAIVTSGEPMVLALPEAGSAEVSRRFLAIAGARRGRVLVVPPDGEPVRVRALELRARLARDVEAANAAAVEGVMGMAAAEQADRARAALLARRLRLRHLSRAWGLRPARPTFFQVAREAGLLRRFGRLLGAYALELALLIVSWQLIGAGALRGRLESGWLWAWGLVLLTMIALRTAASWNAGCFAIDAGALLRQRLLRGALGLDPSTMREQGVGQLLGRVLEAEAVETLAVGGGLWAVAAVFEVGLAALILGAFARATTQVVLLAGIAGAAIWLGARYVRALRRWSHHRRAMTHDLVERMVGRRTLVAQQLPSAWHDGEEAALTRYELLGRELDRISAWMALLPRVWLVVGIAALAPGFATGALHTAMIAVTVAGVLVGQGALRRLTLALPALSGAVIAWEEVAPLFQAARPKQTDRPCSTPDPAVADASAGALMVGRRVTFRHAGRAEPVLDGVSFEIRPGDQVLLEGASGAGKSTLGALLGGLRLPQSGVLLLHGLDHHSLGLERWRRHVGLVPQFHDNHVFGATFMFNVLMGRRWPPTLEDVAACEEVCRDLGLGELLSRMPAGLQQMVGETGWQLSHGERSRLFLARALLRGADLRIFDETFGALDPETLRQVMPHVLRRARTFVLIAHP